MTAVRLADAVPARQTFSDLSVLTARFEEEWLVERPDGVTAVRCGGPSVCRPPPR